MKRLSEKETRVIDGGYSWRCDVCGKRESNPVLALLHSIRAGFVWHKKK